jgi:signal transduction histidine kinase
MNKTRNQISRDLHDELGANVSSINILAKMLARKYADDKYLEPMMGNISQYSIQISDTLNDIIWNISPKFDSMEELIKRMNRLASETLETASISYNITLPLENSQHSIPNNIKYNLFLIFKEALNNIAKYSSAQTVNIIIGLEDKVFHFTITDDGLGFDNSAFEKGNGLGNMQNRANEIGADLSIHSAIDKGTRIKLSFKIQ